MTKEDFKHIRKQLNKTQKEMAVLLSISKKAIESYEQGLRNIPANIERIVYYLFFKLSKGKLGRKRLCWQQKKCSREQRQNCVAWLAKDGYYCWFITGKVCLVEQENPNSHIDNCFECDFFKDNLDSLLPPSLR
jgi:transcriptional regulator with XRE-family HTH domain